jgi:hypothetical protein
LRKGYVRYEEETHDWTCSSPVIERVDEEEE